MFWLSLLGADISYYDWVRFFFQVSVLLFLGLSKFVRMSVKYKVGILDNKVTL